MTSLRAILSSWLFWSTLFACLGGVIVFYGLWLGSGALLTS